MYLVELKRLRRSKWETLTLIEDKMSLNTSYRQQQGETWFRILQACKASLELIH